MYSGTFDNKAECEGFALYMLNKGCVVSLKQEVNAAGKIEYRVEWTEGNSSETIRNAV